MNNHYLLYHFMIHDDENNYLQKYFIINHIIFFLVAPLRSKFFSIFYFSYVTYSNLSFYDDDDVYVQLFDNLNQLFQ